MAIRIASDADDVGRLAADAAAGIMRQAIHDRGRCVLALSGGRTPIPFFEHLARCLNLDWPSVHVFWSDERYVPASDAASNQATARRMLLERVPCPAGNVHPVPTDPGGPEASARRYEREISETFGPAELRFDLLLLGMGADGHIASLFPGSPALAERSRAVTSSMAPVNPVERVTFTLPLILGARAIFVLVTGPEKAAALRRAVTPSTTAPELPAEHLRGASGPVTWWIDAAAARSAGLA